MAFLCICIYIKEAACVIKSTDCDYIVRSAIKKQIQNVQRCLQLLTVMYFLLWVLKSFPHGLSLPV